MRYPPAKWDGFQREKPFIQQSTGRPFNCRPVDMHPERCHEFVPEVYVSASGSGPAEAAPAGSSGGAPGSSSDVEAGGAGGCEGGAGRDSK